MFILFAFVALSVFLIYEVVDRLKEKPLIKANWDLVKAINIAAFIAIYWHGLKVGTHLQDGWLRTLWIFYGLSALIFIVHGYWHDFTAKDQKQ